MKVLSLAGLALVAIAGSAGAQKAQKQVREEIPAEQRPPKGMCRIWLKDVPAAQQPAPTDCAAAVKNNPPNGRVVFGDSEDAKNKTKTDGKAAIDPKQSTPMVKALTGKPPVVKTKPPVAP
jgi:hypothetical protein